MMVIIIVVLVKNAKFWKNRNRKVNRGKYLEAKRKAKRAAYQVKYEAQRNGFADISQGLFKNMKCFYAKKKKEIV